MEVRSVMNRRAKPLFSFIVGILLCLFQASVANAKMNELYNDAFCRLCREGSPEEVLSAIQKGADLLKNDRDGRSPLMNACGYNRNAEVVRILLSNEKYAGAMLYQWDKKCNSSLAYAAVNPNSEVIKILLEKGAVPIKSKVTSIGPSELMLAAAENSNPEVLIMLIKAGADIKAYNTKNNMTPLLYASAYNPNIRIIETLINAEDKFDYKEAGGIALQIAKERNPNPDVAAYLSSRINKENEKAKTKALAEAKAAALEQERKKAEAMAAAKEAAIKQQKMEKEAQARKEKQQAENRKCEENRKAEIRNLEMAKEQIQPTILKNFYFELYPEELGYPSIMDAFNKYFVNPVWKVEKAREGLPLVTITCRGIKKINGEKTLFIFEWDYLLDSGELGPTEMYVNGEYDEESIASMLAKIYL